jgi:hypothetical protein
VEIRGCRFRPRKNCTQSKSGGDVLRDVPISIPPREVLPRWVLQCPAARGEIAPPRAAVPRGPISIPPRRSDPPNTAVGSAKASEDPDYPTYLPHPRGEYGDARDGAPYLEGRSRALFAGHCSPTVRRPNPGCGPSHPTEASTLRHHEAERPARTALGDRPEIRRVDHHDLRLAAHRRTVGHRDDGLSPCRDLDRSRRTGSDRISAGCGVRVGSDNLRWILGSRDRSWARTKAPRWPSPRGQALAEHHWMITRKPSLPGAES